MGRPQRIFSPVVYCLLLVVTLATTYKFNSEEIPPLNFLVFYETNSVRSVCEAANDFFNKTNGYIRLNPRFIKLDPATNDSDTLTESIIQQVEASSDSNGTRPEFAVDFTSTPHLYKTVKAFVKPKKIITIAGGFRPHTEILPWTNLTIEQKGYYLGVNSPDYVLLKAARSLADLQDMINLALTAHGDVTENFGEFVKHNNIFEKSPTRNLITELNPAKNRASLVGQGKKFFSNFFISGSPAEISEFIAPATSDDFNGPTFDDRHAWYSASLNQGLPRCDNCEGPVTIVHLSPNTTVAKSKSYSRMVHFNKRSFFNSKFNKSDSPLRDTFYFELTLSAIHVVAKLKNQRMLEMWKDTIQEGNEVDIMSYIHMDLKYPAQDSLMRFKIDDEGNVAPELTMKIQRLTFDPHQQAPKVVEDIGEWSSSALKGQEAITFNEGMSLESHKALTVFDVVTVVEPPYVSWKEGCEKNTSDEYQHCFQGSCIDLLTEWKQTWGIEFTVRNVSEYGKMTAEAPHEWTGMARELKDKQADFALGAVSKLPICSVIEPPEGRVKYFKDCIRAKSQPRNRGSQDMTRTGNSQFSWSTLYF